MISYTADFETTTDAKDCRVWAYALCNINDPSEFYWGTTFEEFIEFCQHPKKNYTLYFHNLKFDGSFIISWLLRNGFTYISDKVAIFVKEMNFVYEQFLYLHTSFYGECRSHQPDCANLGTNRTLCHPLGAERRATLA